MTKLLRALNEGPNTGCLNCGGHRGRRLRMTDIVAVGFGDAHCSRDGVVIWYEKPNARRFARVRRFEKMASADPDHDWRIVTDGPLHGETYQRHGPKAWVLVRKNGGFA